MNKVVIFILCAVLSLVTEKAKAQSVFAGNGFTTEYDGGSATSSGLYSPRHIAADGNGNIYLTTGYSYGSSMGNVKIRKIDSSGIISTYAGGSEDTSSYANSNVAATNTRFNEVNGLAVDSSNNLHISARLFDPMNNSAQCAIRKIDASSQQVSTYAGQVSSGSSATCSYSGGNGDATSTYLNYNRGIAFDSSNNLYIAESYRLRKVSPGGIISTFAGNGNYGGSTFENSVSYYPTSFGVDPYSVAVDSSDNVYFTDGSSYIRKVTNGGGNMYNFVVSGSTFSDSLAGTSGTLTSDGSNLYVYSSGNYEILQVTSTGYASSLLYLSGSEYHLAYKSGNLYYSDTYSNYVYKYTLSTSSTTSTTYTTSTTSTTSASSGFSLSSYYSSNKQEVLALGASAFTMLAHFGLVSYLAASGVQSVKSADSSADI